MKKSVTFRFHATSVARIVAICILGAGALYAGQVEYVGGNKPSAFASETQFLSYTNESYDKRASVEFPNNPVNHYLRVGTARELLRTGDCKGAIPLLERATKEYADHGDVWGLLGKCRAEVGEWESAADAYKAALKLGVQPWDADLGLNPNDMMLEIAAFYARAGNHEQTLVWLRRALDVHYDERPDIAEASAFVNLRNDNEFKTLAGLKPSGIRTRDDQWRYDIQFLRKQVLLLHADPDHHTPAKTLERMLTDLSAAVPKLSDEQITARIDLFIGALGAGHDLFWPVYPDRGAMLPFALKLYLFTDGLYIIDAYDPELIGSRIDLFGETPATEAYEVVANTFPGDNDMQARWMGVRHLTQAYTLEALGIIDDASIATLTVTDKTSAQRLITPERRGFTPMSPALKAPPGVPTPLYLSRVKENFWTHRVNGLSALYVQLKIVANGEHESIAEFSQRMAKEASEPGISNLILDLRHSPGGNGYLLPPLLRELIRFDASSENNRLFVIISRNTFSASHNLITDLDWIAEPVFVGEPSGSRPNTFSESGHFVLPFSRLSGTLSSQFHQHSWPEDHRIWIAPDVPVGLSSKDYFAGLDPALEAISALIAADSR